MTKNLNKYFPLSMNFFVLNIVLIWQFHCFNKNFRNNITSFEISIHLLFICQIFCYIFLKESSRSMLSMDASSSTVSTLITFLLKSCRGQSLILLIVLNGDDEIVPFVSSWTVPTLLIWIHKQYNETQEEENKKE